MIKKYFYSPCMVHTWKICYIYETKSQEGNRYINEHLLISLHAIRDKVNNVGHEKTKKDKEMKKHVDLYNLREQYSCKFVVKQTPNIDPNLKQQSASLPYLQWWLKKYVQFLIEIEYSYLQQWKRHIT